MFQDVLLTVDYDRTMTGPDSKVPQRNLDAIRYFMDNGGTFTMNTGRSTTTMGSLLETIPVNAPFLLYNGSAAWEKGKLSQLRVIDVPLWEMVAAATKAFPEMNWEIQAVDNHYLIEPREEFTALYDKMKWGWAPAQFGADYGPFLKMAAYGPVRRVGLSDMYALSPEDVERFRELEAFLMASWGDKIDIFRAAPRILDIQAKGVSKGNAALGLKKALGKKILVCVGDAENDLTMLDAADFAFCPGDAVIRERYENVCICGEGAVADVIYEKIPEIIQNRLDIRENLC